MSRVRNCSQRSLAVARAAPRHPSPAPPEQPLESTLWGSSTLHISYDANKKLMKMSRKLMVIRRRVILVLASVRQHVRLQPLIQHATAIPSRIYPLDIPYLSVTFCKLAIPYDDGRLTRDPTRRNSNLFP